MTPVFVIVAVVLAFCVGGTIAGSFMFNDPPPPAVPTFDPTNHSTQRPRITTPATRPPVTIAPSTTRPPVTTAPSRITPTTPAPESEDRAITSSFRNCTEMRRAFPSGVGRGHPAYERKHDRNRDGRACE